MKLEGLQAGRAIAALMVAAFHINVFVLPARLFDGASAWPGFGMGYAGVEFFFVLSGFIMMLVHVSDFGKPERSTTFLWKRIVRIYPLYWIVFGALSLLYFAMPDRGPANARDPWALISSALLLPTSQPPILEVAWTLRHEMLFYLVFLSIIFNKKFGIVLLCAWQILCILFVNSDLSFPSKFIFSYYNVLFLFGMLAALGFRHLTGAKAMIALLFGGAIFFGVGLSEALAGWAWPQGPRTIAYGIGAAFGVAGLAAGAVRSPAWLGFLGDASYSVYLTHMPAILMLVAILVPLGAPWTLDPLAVMGLLLVWVAIVGGVVHVVVERPLLRQFKRRRPSATAG